jgi:hypothetical protein
MRARVSLARAIVWSQVTRRTRSPSASNSAWRSASSSRASRLSCQAAPSASTTRRRSVGPTEVRNDASTVEDERLVDGRVGEPAAQHEIEHRVLELGASRRGARSNDPREPRAAAPWPEAPEDIEELMDAHTPQGLGLTDGAAQPPFVELGRQVEQGSRRRGDRDS